MDSLTEEKKELESVEEKNFGHEARGNDWEGDSGDEELVDLPTELSGLNNKTYEFLDDLEGDLKNLGFPDLFVVLDPKTRKPRLRMTTGAHDKITDSFTREFNEDWGKNRWGAASESTNVFIQPLPGRRPTRRKPDIAFWGYGKCVVNKKGKMFPKDLDSPPKLTNSTSEQTERVNPDVVFQFSWGNSFGYEKNAIDDMMNRVLVVPDQRNNEGPKLGFLVKARTHKKRLRDGRKKYCVLIYSESLVAQQSLMRKPTAMEPAWCRARQGKRRTSGWKSRHRIWAFKASGRCYVLHRSRFRQKKYASCWNSEWGL